MGCLYLLREGNIFLSERVFLGSMLMALCLFVLEFLERIRTALVVLKVGKKTPGM